MQLLNRSKGGQGLRLACETLVPGRVGVLVRLLWRELLKLRLGRKLLVALWQTERTKRVRHAKREKYESNETDDGIYDTKT